MTSTASFTVSGLDELKSNLKKILTDVSAGTTKAILDGSEKVQTAAQNYAPVDFGNLEESIKREISKSPGSLSINIGVDMDQPVPDSPTGKVVGDYAMQMHEGQYSLGEKSEQKARALGVQVGPGYLTRALTDATPEVLDGIEAAIRKALGF